MQVSVQQRWIMTAIGAAGALALYVLIDLGEADILQGRSLLAAVTMIGSFCVAVLLMNGAISLRPAAIGGAALAVIITALTQIAAFKFADIGGFLSSAQPVLMMLVLLSLTLPFWIAHVRGNWRDYDSLFSEAWAIVLRKGIATIFVGVVWLLIFLSNLLLSIVGVTIIEELLDLPAVPYLITGAALGLGLAVVQELSDVIGPHLILRLLRLLLPLVLAVVAVFLLALPFRGLSGLFGGISVGLTLLSIVAVATTLITAVIDQRDSAASDSPILLRAARIMGLLLPVMAVLGATAIFLRVRQYGWTPDRIFAAEIAVLALGYGGLYADAVLRKGAWMARIRHANVTMAIAVMALAAINLTPILNAERISTNSQMARFADGRTAVENLDIQAFEQWGIAGANALIDLTVQSKLAGQDALAQLLAGNYSAEDSPIINPQRAELAAHFPNQPADIFDNIDEYYVTELLTACKSEMPTGGKGCAMAMADLLPNVAGNEAIFLYLMNEQAQIIAVMDAQPAFPIEWRLVNGGLLPQGEQAEALIRSWQAGPPLVEPAQVNQITLGDGVKMLFLNQGQ